MSLGDKLKIDGYRSITSVDFNVTFEFSSFAFNTHFRTTFALSYFRILYMFTFALSHFITSLVILINLLLVNSYRTKYDNSH